MAAGAATTKKKTKKTLRRRSEEKGDGADRERGKDSRGSDDFNADMRNLSGEVVNREAPSALKPESLDYLDTEEISPCIDPRADLNKATAALLTEDWLEIFHALNIVRQLSLHHQSILLNSGKPGGSGTGNAPMASPGGLRSPMASAKGQAPVLRALASAVLKQVDNLRSQVAKNAIVTLGDMFLGLRTKMDPEVPTVVPVLVKKCGDQSTSFLSESAESTLCHLIDHSSPARSLNAFVAASDNRNPALRGKVAGFLGFLISQKAEELRTCHREMETLRVKLKTLINDNTPEARASSRDIVRIMLETRLSTRAELEMLIPAKTIDKAIRSAPNVHLSPKRSASVKKGNTSPKKSRSTFGSVKTTPTRSSIASNSAAPSLSDESAPNLNLDLSRFNITPAHGPLLSDDEDDVESSSGTVDFVSPIKKKPVPSASRTTPSRKPAASSNATSPPGPSSSLTADMSNIPNGMGTPSRAKATAAKRQIDNNEELQGLPDLLKGGAVSASWRDRMDAMSTVTDLVCKYMICLRDSSKLEQCMECILSGLDDGSVKVNLQCLQCLHKIHMEIPALLPSMQLSVLPALLKAASSGNKSVSSGAQPVLKNILSSCGVQHVVTHLCHMSLYEADRLRIVALRVLADHIPRVCGSGNPATNNAVKMTIFPTIKTILLGSGAAAARGEVRVNSAEVLKEIQRACPMGEHVWTWLEDPRDQDAIKKAVGG